MTSDEGQKMVNFKVDPEKFGGLIAQVKNIDKTTSDIKVLIEKQNGRIGKLETWRSGIIAMIITATGLISAYLRYFTE